MGAELSKVKEPEGSKSQDGYYANLSLESLSNHSFAEQNYSSLPEYLGTEKEKEEKLSGDKMKDYESLSSNDAEEFNKIYSLLSKDSRGRELVDDFLLLKDTNQGVTKLSPYEKDYRKRLRLLKRYHQSYIRLHENHEDNDDAGQKAKNTFLKIDQSSIPGSEVEESPNDIATGLTAGMCLGIINALDNDKLFLSMVDSMMEILKNVKASSFSVNKVSPVLMRTMEQIDTYAQSKVDTPSCRSEALALLFAIAYITGSLEKVLYVSRTLLKSDKGLQDNALACLQELADTQVSHDLDFLKQDGVASTFAVNSIFEPKDGSEMEEYHKYILDSVSAMAADGSFVYLWDAYGGKLVKMTNGLKGSVPGDEVCVNKNVLQQFSDFVGAREEKVEEEGDSADLKTGGSEGDGGNATGLGPTTGETEETKEEELDLSSKVWYLSRNADFQVHGDDLLLTITNQNFDYNRPQSQELMNARSFNYNESVLHGGNYNTFLAGYQQYSESCRTLDDGVLDVMEYDQYFDFDMGDDENRGLSLEEKCRLYGGLVKDMPSYTAALKNDDPSRPIMYFEVEIQNSCLTMAQLALETEGAPNFIGAPEEMFGHITEGVVASDDRRAYYDLCIGFARKTHIVDNRNDDVNMKFATKGLAKNCTFGYTNLSFIIPPCANPDHAGSVYPDRDYATPVMARDSNNNPQPYHVGDTVGCGYDPVTDMVFFTLNGVRNARGIRGTDFQAGLVGEDNSSSVGASNPKLFNIMEYVPMINYMKPPKTVDVPAPAKIDTGTLVRASINIGQKAFKYAACNNGTGALASASASDEEPKKLVSASLAVVNSYLYMHFDKKLAVFDHEDLSLVDLVDLTTHTSLKEGADNEGNADNGKERDTRGGALSISKPLEPVEFVYKSTSNELCVTAFPGYAFHGIRSAIYASTVDITDTLSSVLTKSILKVPLRKGNSYTNSSEMLYIGDLGNLVHVEATAAGKPISGSDNEVTIVFQMMKTIEYQACIEQTMSCYTKPLKCISSDGRHLAFLEQRCVIGDNFKESFEDRSEDDDVRQNNRKMDMYCYYPRDEIKISKITVPASVNDGTLDVNDVEFTKSITTVPSMDDDDDGGDSKKKCLPTQWGQAIGQEGEGQYNACVEYTITGSNETFYYRYHVGSNVPVPKKVLSEPVGRARAAEERQAAREARRQENRARRIAEIREEDSEFDSADYSDDDYSDDDYSDDDDDDSNSVYSLGGAPEPTPASDAPTGESGEEEAGTDSKGEKDKEAIKKAAFPNLHMLYRHALPHLMGIKQSLFVVFRDIHDLSTITKEFNLSMPFDKSAISEEEWHSLLSFYTNGDKLVLSLSKSEVAGYDKKDDKICSRVNSYIYDLKMNNDKSNALVIVDNHEEVYTGIEKSWPQAVYYDIANNMIWSYNRYLQTMMRWRNNGLPITLFKANPALLLTTGKSDADGSTYLPLLGDDVNDKLRYLNANSNGTAEHQSGTILASLEKVAQSYGIDYGNPPAELDILSTLSVNSRAKTTTTAGCCSIEVKGQVVSAVSETDTSDGKKGIHVVVLNSDYHVIDKRLFSTYTNSGDENNHDSDSSNDLPTSKLGIKDSLDLKAHGDSLADFLDGREPGQIILIASCYNACSKFFSSRVVDSLVGIGAPAKDAERIRNGLKKKATQGTSLCMIGYKGAIPGSVPFYLNKGDKMITLTQKLSSISIPLCIQPTQNVIADLISDIQLTHEAIAAALLTKNLCNIAYKVSALISLLKLLSVNLYQLSSGNSTETISTVVPQDTLEKLKSLVNRVLEVKLFESDRVQNLPPVFSQCAAESILHTSMGLFNASLPIIYPTAASKMELVIHFLDSFQKGTLSKEEVEILAQLLSQMASQETVVKLLQAKNEDLSTCTDTLKALIEYPVELFDRIQACVEANVKTQLLQVADKSIGMGDKKVLANLVRFRNVLSLSLLNRSATNMYGPEEKMANPNESDGVKMLFDLLSSVGESCVRTCDVAINISDKIADSTDDNALPMLHRAVEAVLRKSALGTLLPQIFVAITIAVEKEIKSLVGDGIRLYDMSKLLQRIQRVTTALTKRLPVDDLVDTNSLKTITTIKEQIIESAHPYSSNANINETYFFPNASRLYVEFDEKCATEGRCDMLKISDLDGKLLFEAYGRRSSRNFPGLNGKSAYEFPPGCQGFKLHFFSDYSDEDWGYRMTVTAHMKETNDRPNYHWLLSLTHDLVHCLSRSAHQLIVGTEIQEHENNHYMFIEDTIINPDLFEGTEGNSEEDVFLREFLSFEEDDGSLAAHLVARMRDLRLDQGRDIAENRAAYSTCAVLCKYNNLAAEALRVAKSAKEWSDADKNGTSTTELPAKIRPSQQLQSAWKSGVKMKNFFKFADLQNSMIQAGGGDTRRTPALHMKSEDKVKLAAATIVVNKARFLLLNPKSGGSDQVSDKQRAARAKWDILRKAVLSGLVRTMGSKKDNGGAEDLGPPLSDATRPPTLQRGYSAPISHAPSKFFNVVAQAQSADRLRGVISFRRKYGGKADNNLTLTEQILRFQQNHVDIMDLNQLYLLRCNRAKRRSLGIKIIANQLTEVIDGCTGLRTSLGLMPALVTLLKLSGTSIGNIYKSETAKNDLHYMRSLVGCSNSLKADVADQFSKLLKGVTNVINFVNGMVFDENGYFAPEIGAIQGLGAEYMKLLKSCFSIISLDYLPEDGALLDESGVIRSVISFIEHDTVSSLLSTSTPPPAPLSSGTNKADAKKEGNKAKDDNGRRDMMIEKKNLFDLAHQFLELVTNRCLMFKSGAGGPTKIGKQIIKLLTDRLDSSASMAVDLRATRLFEEDTDVDSKSVSSIVDMNSCQYWNKPHSIIDDIKALGPRSKAYVSSHIDVCSDHSFSLWLRFSDDSILDMEQEMKREFVPGCKVIRGNDGDWSENPDGGVGSTGIVKDISDDKNIRVKWDRTGAESTHNYTDLSLVLTQRDGHIYSKGAPFLETISDKGETKQVSQSFGLFGLSLLPDASLCAFATTSENIDDIDAINKCQYVKSPKKMPLDKWVHVCVVKNDRQMTLYMNGESVSTNELPARAVYPLVYEKIYESPHPLPTNTSQVIEISLPEKANKGELCFDKRCYMSSEDSLIFYKDKECTEKVNESTYGGGGRNPSVYPGLEGMSVLEMKDTKTLYMKVTTSDCANCWGYRFTLTVSYPKEVETEFDERYKDDKQVMKPKSAVLNKMPFYIGQRPSYVCNSFVLTKKCFHGFIGHMTIFDKVALSSAEVSELSSLSSKITAKAKALTYFDEKDITYSLSTLHRAMKIVLRGENSGYLMKTMDVSNVVRTLMRLSLGSSTDDPRLERFALKVCAEIVPHVECSLVAMHASELNYIPSPPSNSDGSKDSQNASWQALFIKHILRDVGEQSAIQGPSFKTTPSPSPAVSSNSPVDGNESDASSVVGNASSSSNGCAHYSMDQGYNISQGKLDILHNIATHGSDSWKALLAQICGEIISSLPDILNILVTYLSKTLHFDDAWTKLDRAYADFCANKTDDLDNVEKDTVKEKLYLVYGLIAFMGGSFNNHSPGSHLLYAKEGSVAEECVILGNTPVPEFLEFTKKHRNKLTEKEVTEDEKKQKQVFKMWEGYNQYGDAFVVSTLTEAHKPMIVPRNSLRIESTHYDKTLRKAILRDFIEPRLGPAKLNAFFNAIVTLDISDTRGLPLSPQFKAVEDDKEKDKEEKEDDEKEKDVEVSLPFETEHPYDLQGLGIEDNKIVQNVYIADVSAMELRFDNRSKLGANDMLRISYFVENSYAEADEAERNRKSTRASFRETVIDISAKGLRTRLANGAGVVRIKSDKCTVTLMEGPEAPSKGRKNKWGYLFHACAVIPRKRAVPPALPVLPMLSIISHCKMLGMKALYAALEGGEGWVLRDILTNLTPSLVQSALITPADLHSKPGVDEAGKSRPVKVTEVIESEHPYKDNVNFLKEIKLNGAKELSISFDPRTSTEGGSDWVQFYADEGKSKSLSQRFSGSYQNGGWPKKDNPLVIEGNSVWIYFYSDSSVVDWGWVCEVEASVTQLVAVDVDMGHSVATSTCFIAQQFLSDGSAYSLHERSETTSTYEDLKWFPKSIPFKYSDSYVNVVDLDALPSDENEMDASDRDTSVVEYKHTPSHFGYSVCNISGSHTKDNLTVYKESDKSSEVIKPLGLNENDTAKWRLLSDSNLVDQPDQEWVKVMIMPTLPLDANILYREGDSTEQPCRDDFCWRHTKEDGSPGMDARVAISADKMVVFCDTNTRKGQSGNREVNVMAEYGIDTASSDFKATGNYFEITIVDLESGNSIGYGLCPESYSISGQYVGWRSGSWGLHGDDGHVYAEEKAYGFPLFNVGDTMGMGYIGSSQTLFFTKNGKVITGDRVIKCDNTKYGNELLHPCVSFYGNRGDTTVAANFGLDKFAFEGDADHPVIRATCIIQERTRRENVMNTVKNNLEQRRAILSMLESNSASDTPVSGEKNDGSDSDDEDGTTSTTDGAADASTQFTVEDFGIHEGWIHLPSLDKDKFTLILDPTVVGADGPLIEAPFFGYDQDIEVPEQDLAINCGDFVLNNGDKLCLVCDVKQESDNVSYVLQDVKAMSQRQTDAASSFSTESNIVSAEVEKVGSAIEYCVSDRVWGLYRGHENGTRWYPGKIAVNNGNNLYEIHYEDGETERGVSGCYIRHRDNDDHMAKVTQAQDKFTAFLSNLKREKGKPEKEPFPKSLADWLSTISPSSELSTRSSSNISRAVRLFNITDFQKNKGTAGAQDSNKDGNKLLEDSTVKGGHPSVRCLDKTNAASGASLGLSEIDADARDLQAGDVIRPDPSSSQYLERCLWRHASVAVNSFAVHCLYLILQAWPQDVPFSMDLFGDISKATAGAEYVQVKEEELHESHGMHSPTKPPPLSRIDSTQGRPRVERVMEGLNGLNAFASFAHIAVSHQEELNRKEQGDAKVFAPLQALQKKYLDMINTMDMVDIMTPVKTPKRRVSAPSLPPLPSSPSRSSIGGKSGGLKTGGHVSHTTTAAIVPLMINYATRTLQDKAANDNKDNSFDSTKNHSSVVHQINIDRNIMKEGTSGADAEVNVVPYEVAVVHIPKASHLVLDFNECSLSKYSILECYFGDITQPSTAPTLIDSVYTDKHTVDEGNEARKPVTSANLRPDLVFSGGSTTENIHWPVGRDVPRIRHKTSTISFILKTGYRPLFWRGDARHKNSSSDYKINIKVWGVMAHGAGKGASNDLVKKNFPWMKLYKPLACWILQALLVNEKDKATKAVVSSSAEVTVTDRDSSNALPPPPPTEGEEKMNTTESATEQLRMRLYSQETLSALMHQLLHDSDNEAKKSAIDTMLLYLQGVSSTLTEENINNKVVNKAVMDEIVIMRDHVYGGHIQLTKYVSANKNFESNNYLYTPYTQSITELTVMAERTVLKWNLLQRRIALRASVDTNSKIHPLDILSTLQTKADSNSPDTPITISKLISILEILECFEPGQDRVPASIYDVLYHPIVIKYKLSAEEALEYKGYLQEIFAGGDYDGDQAITELLHRRVQQQSSWNPEESYASLFTTMTKDMDNIDRVPALKKLSGSSHVLERLYKDVDPSSDDVEKQTAKPISRAQKLINSLRCGKTDLKSPKTKLNRAGCVICLSKQSGYTENYYCGRIVGRENLSGSDGQCGPNDGPACPDCAAGPVVAAVEGGVTAVTSIKPEEHDKDILANHFSEPFPGMTLGAPAELVDVYTFTSKEEAFKAAQEAPEYAAVHGVVYNAITSEYTLCISEDLTEDANSTTWMLLDEATYTAKMVAQAEEKAEATVAASTDEGKDAEEEKSEHKDTDDSNTKESDDNDDLQEINICYGEDNMLLDALLNDWNARMVGLNNRNSTDVLRKFHSPLDMRWRIVQTLNRYLRRGTMKCFNLNDYKKLGSMSYLLCKYRSLIWLGSTRDLASAALDGTRTTSYNQFGLAVSRSRAKKHINAGECDHNARFTIFGQAFRIIHPMPPSCLRRQDKLYEVVFMGEYAQDAGGPYRETFDMYMEELQSTALPLLYPPPNRTHAAGECRDRWILNPNALSTLELEMYCFFGKIMGIAIRSRGFLNLNLSKFIWKLIAGEEPTITDLRMVDESFVDNSLIELRDPPEGVTPENFEYTYCLTYDCLGTDEDSNNVHELVPGGKDISVTWDNRLEYIQLLQDFRLHEFDRQASAIRQGLATVIPLSLINTISSTDLELMVCGTPEIDLDLLKEMTEYEYCNSSDLFITRFWNVMRSFNTEERQALVKFVWGRTRLPLNKSSFDQTFKIQKYNCSNPDAYFPLAHTCFFSMELPEYSSEEIMREKLLYAIFNATEMDLDANEIGAAAVAMGFED